MTTEQQLLTAKGDELKPCPKDRACTFAELKPCSDCEVYGQPDKELVDAKARGDEGYRVADMYLKKMKTAQGIACDVGMENKKVKKQNKELVEALEEINEDGLIHGLAWVIARATEAIDKHKAKLSSKGLLNN